MTAKMLYSLFGAAMVAASALIVQLSSADAQTRSQSRATLLDRIGRSRMRQAFTITHGITGDTIENSWDPISGAHFTPDEIAKQAHAAFQQAKTTLGGIESVEAWCRDNFAVFSFKERDQLMVRALSLLDNNKLEEENAALKQVNQLEELDKAFGDMNCKPEASPLAAQDSKDIVDSKGEYTNRGVAIATIAAAQVAEMRCGAKGWIIAAIQKFDKMGLHVNVNDKEDYSSILFFASDILKKADKIGASKWCKDTTPQLVKILEGQ
jgi:hypothetical protein